MDFEHNDEMEINRTGDEELEEVNGGKRSTPGQGITSIVCDKCGKKYAVPKYLADSFILRQQGKCMCGGALKKTEATSFSEVWKY